MKKLIVLLLAFAVAAGAFAQAAAPALTFGAYGDVTATPYASSGNTAYAVYSETYFNYKNGAFAFSATTVGGQDFFAATRNYSLTYQIIPELAIKAGALREGTARLTSYIDGNGFSTRVANVNNGIMAVVNTSGITAGAFVPLLAGTVATDFGKTNIAVQYAVPNLVTVVGGYRLQNAELWVGADVKAVKGVVAKVGFQSITTAGVAANKIYATAGSSALVPNLDVGLDAALALTNTKYGVQVNAMYKLNPTYAVGAKVKYDNGDAWYGTNGVWAKPYVKAFFGPGTLTAGVTYNAVTGAMAVPVDFEMSF